MRFPRFALTDLVAPKAAAEAFHPECRLADAFGPVLAASGPGTSPTGTDPSLIWRVHPGQTGCRGAVPCRHRTLGADLMSTHPQLGTQLGTDSHGCSYPHGSVVTSASAVVFSQVRRHRTRFVSPHAVDNPGGGASCRPVDDALVCAQPPTPARSPHGTRPPPRNGMRASGSAGAGRGRQRQRIDMIRPATMAPNPMAKFHAESDTMSGMRSPAT